MTVYEVKFIGEFHSETVANFMNKRDAKQCVEDFIDNINDPGILIIKEHYVIPAGEYRKENIDTTGYWFDKEEED